MPRALQISGMATPLASSASASRSLRMICSGEWRIRFIESPPALSGENDSHIGCANPWGAGQENLIAQLKGGVKALAMPVGDLVSNWAYMVMASLAWSLKAWAALLLPEGGRWAERHRVEKRSLLRMEFATFCVALIQVPCQVGRTSRRIVYRLLAWNPWQG